MNIVKPLVCLAMLLTLSACQPAAKVVDTAADEAAIRRVLDEVASTFNAGNYDGMFALYRDDVVISAPGAPDIVGKPAWREGLKALPAGVPLKLRFDTQELEVAGDLAYERGTYAVEAPDTNGALVEVSGGRHIHIFKREADGSWKGWRLFENSADPAAPAPPPPPPAAPAPTRTFGE